MSLFDFRKIPGYDTVFGASSVDAPKLYNRAAKAVGWGSGNEVAKSIPRFKFNFFARFSMHGDVSYGDWLEAEYGGSIMTALKSIDIPAVSYEVETIKQYNRPRNIYVRTELKEISVTFYDDATSFIHGMLAAYRSHYTYMGAARPEGVGTSGPPLTVDGGGTTIVARTVDSVNIDTPFTALDGGSDYFPTMGMRPVTFDFFQGISIFDLGSEPSSANIYHVYKPKIKDVTTGTLDYGDNDSPQEITVTFVYEHLVEQIGVNWVNEVYNSQMAVPQVYDDGIQATIGNRENASVFDANQTGNGSAPSRSGIFQPDTTSTAETAVSGLQQALQNPASQAALTRAGVATNDLMVAVQKSIQGGVVNYDDLKENIFRALAKGTAIQDIRNAATKAKLVRQAIEQGRFMDVAPLLGSAISPIENFSWETSGQTVKSVVNTINNGTSGASTWIETHSNVSGLKKLGGAFGIG